MEPVAALMCLGSLYTGVLWIQYQAALLLGTGGFLFVAGFAFAILTTSLCRAPEARERPDGFHVRLHSRGASPFRYTRFSQPAGLRQ
jgi:hypothetical protein